MIMMMIPYNDHDHGGYDDLDGDDNDDADADADADDADDHESEQADLFSKKELRLKLGVDQVEHVQHRGVVHLAKYLSIHILVLQLISNTSQEMSSWIFFFVASLVRKSLRIEIVEMLSDLKSALPHENSVTRSQTI